MSFFDTEQGNKLVAAVLAAGDLLLQYWPGSNPKSVAAIQEKSDGSLVSTADLESNRVLTTALKNLFPDEVIFSEEEINDPKVISAAEKVWIIDPLDGTSAFLSGRDDFSILVGRSQRKRPTEGIMFFPARGILVLAEQGRGVMANGTRLSVSSHKVIRPGGIYIRNWSCPRPEIASPSMDSGLALYKVAAGELEGVVIRMVTHKEWDIAAPALAILEAGGLVTDERGAEVEVGVGEISFDYLIASNGAIHEELRALIPVGGA
jgi:myo-inositol-1(or 4)-monophosphatase